jgi:hypothetical protein
MCGRCGEGVRKAAVVSLPSILVAAHANVWLSLFDFVTSGW